MAVDMNTNESTASTEFPTAGLSSMNPTTEQETVKASSFSSPISSTLTSALTLQSSHKPFTQIQSISHNAKPPVRPPSTRTVPPTSALKRSDPFQFGTRFLESTDDVYAWNAWDHVDSSADPGFVEYAQKQYAFQKEHAVSDFDRRRFEAEPGKWWDKFYGNNKENFFKHRKWLRQEFEALKWVTRNWDVGDEGDGGGDGEDDGGGGGGDDAAAAMGTAQSSRKTSNLTTNGTATEEPKSSAASSSSLPQNSGPWNTVLEIGAGAGNTAFPLMRWNRNPDLFVHAVDFSSKAVALMKTSDLYDSAHMVASQWDMASPTSLPQDVAPGSIDMVILVFAFSALSPKQWAQAVQNIWDVLRPGGEVCFRDYGRGDLAQVRFRKGRLLGNNFYVRGDGTRVFFFEENELRRIWGGRVGEAAKEALGESLEGEQEGHEDLSTAERESPAGETSRSPAFEILEMAADRRLLVNRKKQLKMYRCWMQGRFRKPLND